MTDDTTPTVSVWKRGDEYTLQVQDGEDALSLDLIPYAAGRLAHGILFDMWKHNPIAYDHAMRDLNDAIAAIEHIAEITGSETNTSS